MSSSLADYERAILDPGGGNRALSMMDIIKIFATGTDAVKAKLSMADLALRDGGGAAQKKSVTDMAYNVSPTPVKTTLADRSLADFKAGGLSIRTTLAELAYRRTI